jgi:putative hemolysin
MAKKKTNPILIIIIILFLLFFIGYFLVPFANNSFLNKIYSPFCSIKKMYQGEEYLPAWCLNNKSGEQEKERENISNENINSNINQPTNTNDSVGIANPAAVNCLEDGGTLEAYTTEAGEAALCVFDDNSICNQWAYYRGECQPGECFKECQKTATDDEGWYNSCTDELIESANCSKENDDDKQDEEQQPVSSGSIKVFSPTQNQQLSSPFTIEGQSIVKDNKVYIRVKNTQDKVLIEETTTASTKPGTEWADFSIDIRYEFETTEEGFVEVYSLDNQGREVNLVSLPVKF